MRGRRPLAVAEGNTGKASLSESVERRVRPHEPPSPSSSGEHSTVVSIYESLQLVVVAALRCSQIEVKAELQSLGDGALAVSPSGAHLLF